MNRVVIVAELWCGPHVVRTVSDAPSAADLDVIALALTVENDGVRPVVRTVEQVASVEQ